jgi:hypothetical protein
MKNKSAVEWLEKELKKIPFANPKEAFEQAKQMEHEQQERMYSEEDLRESWHNGMKSDLGFFGSFKEWFEQFKNK